MIILSASFSILLSVAASFATLLPTLKEVFCRLLSITSQELPVTAFSTLTVLFLGKQIIFALRAGSCLNKLILISALTLRILTFEFAVIFLSICIFLLIQ